jgi:regulator of replication initiation timing
VSNPTYREMLDAAEAHISSLQAELERVKADAHGHYQPQIDELIKENNALTARNAQMREALRKGIDLCTDAPLMAHNDDENESLCEVCTWQERMNEWYVAQEAALAQYDEEAKCPRGVNCGDAYYCANHDICAADAVKPVSHKVTCKMFPDPYDERDPVGPCDCGAIP